MFLSVFLTIYFHDPVLFTVSYIIRGWMFAMVCFMSFHFILSLEIVIDFFVDALLRREMRC
uniref:Uncharacterized protein n=1 Tax=Nelumbo nucifera TaxID=4432 RepID=A0A822ZA23_NELNU|nr:TPA_asm: hypothetical protein HUJ06_009020 [Nelumbo nucifera]